MSDTRYNFGDTIIFEVRFDDASGNGITDANGEIQIRRQSDNKFWTEVVWQDAPFTLSMTEIGEANLAGIWQYSFDTTPHEEIDVYVVEITDSSGNAENTPFNLLEAIVGGYLDALEDITDRILALQKDNFVHEPLAYNDDNIMTQGRIRCYDSVVNANLNDGATGLIYEYLIIAVIVDKKLICYTQTRVL